MDATARAEQEVGTCVADGVVGHAADGDVGSVLQLPEGEVRVNLEEYALVVGEDCKAVFFEDTEAGDVVGCIELVGDVEECAACDLRFVCVLVVSEDVAVVNAAEVYLCGTADDPGDSEALLYGYAEVGVCGGFVVRKFCAVDRLVCGRERKLFCGRSLLR